MAGKLKIELKKGKRGRDEHQRRILQGLGLRYRHHVVTREDSPAIRGMIKKVDFMLSVEEC